MSLPRQTERIPEAGWNEMRVTPGELRVGDIVTVDRGEARVLTEPMTMHSGLSPFDDFRVLVGTKVAYLSEARPSLERWEPGAALQIRRATTPMEEQDRA